MKTYADRNLLLKVYYALIESHMSYGCVVWGNSSKQNFNRIFLMQKKAIRIIGKIKKRDTCRGHFKQLKILTFACLYIYKVILLFKKHKEKEITKNIHNHGYNTRGKMIYLL